MNRREHIRGKGLFGLIFSEQYRNWKSRHSRANYWHKHRLPLMRIREILLLEELLANLQPSKCLEWGSGYSTLYYPQFATPRTHWMAIEHNAEWAERISDLNENPHVKVVSIPAQQFPWTDANDDGAYYDLKDYVDYAGMSKPYDFILVDGRARIECLKRAYEWISDEGVVVLHDSMRQYYHPPLKIFPHQKMFEILGQTSQGLWLGSKTEPIEKYLNVVRHNWLWSIHNRQRNRRLNIQIDPQS